MGVLNEKDLLIDLNLNLKKFQTDFWYSTARFPAFIAGWGTGKTLFGILRAIDLSQEIPNNLGLIVRKEFTDLQDSTIRDFEKYTGMRLDSKREVQFNNGSVIMFRHGKELDTLKNINLGWFMMEQAEEFETEEQFEFLRGRLRRANVSFHTGFVIGNTNGHNWIWKIWKNNPPSKEYQLFEANTFENEENLPKDYVEDLKRMRNEAPAQFNRYVMNSWEDYEEFDTLIPYNFVAQCINQKFNPNGGFIIACDPAHFGDDETVITVLQKCPESKYKQVYLEGYNGQDLMFTAGKLIELRKRLGIEKVSSIIIDDVGLGTGLCDRLIEQKIVVIRYRGNFKSIDPDFRDKRAEDYWKLRCLLEKKLLDLLPNEKQTQQLIALKFGFKSNGKKYVESKEEAKKRGIKSPDFADCLAMATSIVESIPEPEKELTSAEKFWEMVKRDIELIQIRQGVEDETFRPL